jgi:hypothetical protein
MEESLERILRKNPGQINYADIYQASKTAPEHQEEVQMAAYSQVLEYVKDFENFEELEERFGLEEEFSESFSWSLLGIALEESYSRAREHGLKESDRREKTKEAIIYNL